MDKPKDQRLSEEETEQLYQEGRCFKCKKPSHKAYQCHLKNEEEGEVANAATESIMDSVLMSLEEDMKITEDTWIADS